MGTTCSWVAVWRNLRAAGHRAAGRRSLGHPQAAPGPDAVIQQVCRGGPMTVAELHRAAAVLHRHVGSGRMDVLATRLRIAVRLEALGG
jgi:hypothetical protein